VELAQSSVEARGLTFSYLEAGPADGPLALCLHGFPDSAWTYRHLLPELAEAGFRAVAPWMRGYAPTDVPPDGRYQTGALAADANALHEALGGDGRAVIVGHDWGASATYGALSSQPDRWARGVTMAVPPFAAMAGGFLTYRQLKRSWYMFFFQSPLADMAVAADDLAFIERLWVDWSPGYEGRDDVAHVKDALRGTANLQAALGYYRATFGTAPPDPALAAEQAATAQIPSQPVLYLHGRDDGCLGVELVGGVSAFLSAGSAAEIIDDCGHFLHVEKPKEVNTRIVDFLTS
jgi:pimeloyl-ACP methyl ester carboxylesterase